MWASQPANAGDIDMGLIPGLGRSLGGRNGNPLQHSRLENPMDRGARRAVVFRAAELGMTEVTEHTCVQTRMETDLHSRPSLCVCLCIQRNAHEFLLKLLNCIEGCFSIMEKIIPFLP